MVGARRGKVRDVPRRGSLPRREDGGGRRRGHRIRHRPPARRLHRASRRAQDDQEHGGDQRPLRRRGCYPAGCGGRAAAQGSAGQRVRVHGARARIRRRRAARCRGCGQGCETPRGGGGRGDGGHVCRHSAGERLQGSEQIHGEGGRAHQGGERRARPRERRGQGRAPRDGASGAPHRCGGWRAARVAPGLRPGLGRRVGRRAPVTPRRGGGVASGRGRPRRAEGGAAPPRRDERVVRSADWRGPVRARRRGDGG
mmetsp:Transcript_2234/g.9506  ORF Transcript_2234/g.9506 Transcript_2234/m.9506 type:complete len:255 (-) Transcript_2234:2640-3404(-)